METPRRKLIERELPWSKAARAGYLNPPLPQALWNPVWEPLGRPARSVLVIMMKPRLSREEKGGHGRGGGRGRGSPGQGGGTGVQRDGEGGERVF